MAHAVNCVLFELITMGGAGESFCLFDGPQGLALWNIETGTRQIYYPIEGRWPQLSQDGTTLMSVCGNSKKLWDTKTGTELAVITGGKLIKLSPDGKSAASYSLGDGIIEIWDVDDLLDAAE